jgi:arabinogalactan oligomer/maltooligosaccharide transport system substrate-binding protein
MRTSKTFVSVAVAIGLVAAACAGTEADSTTTTSPNVETTTAPEATTTTAASTTTTTSPDPTTITTEATPPLVLWADETGAAVLRGYIADFQSATGIPVVVEVFAADEIVPRIRDKDGSIGTPDLFMGSHRWIAQLQAEGLVAEVKLPYPGQYFPLALDAFTVNGTLYGLPYAIESPALYRNTDLVPEAPADFGALVASCETLEAANRCLGIPADDPEAHLAIVNAFGGYGFGYGDSGFDATDVGLDTEGALSAARFIDQQVKAGNLHEAVGAEAATELFRLGTEAFLLSGPVPNPGPDNWDASPFEPPGAGSAAILQLGCLPVRASGCR